MKKEDFYNDIGLFRFSLIAPALNNTHGFSSANAYFHQISSQSHFFNGKPYNVSYHSLRKWFQLYKKYGFDSLTSHSRCDKNHSRKLSHETILRIIELREQFPKITGTNIYNKLINEGFFSSSQISKSTLLRYLKNNNLKANENSCVERRMFEMPHVNDCWQADTSSGPYIVINNKKYRTFLIMFIDDKSRLITGFDFFLNDNSINMQSVFKKAILTYGVPKKLFVDNGGPYDNKQLRFICASLGIQLIHAKAYSPESKAKIERSFKTIKEGWMHCTDWNSFQSLNDIKESLQNFLYNNYNNKIHSSFGVTPNERWHQEYDEVVFKDEEVINTAFLHQMNRKVRKDRTIMFEKKYYEVPYKYVGKNITLKYNPIDTQVLYICENDETIECRKVNVEENSRVKRKNNIDYSKAINDERNVIEMEE